MSSDDTAFAEVLAIIFYGDRRVLRSAVRLLYDAGLMSDEDVASTRYSSIIPLKTPRAPARVQRSKSIPLENLESCKRRLAFE